MTTAEAPTIVVTPDAARAQANGLEKSTAGGDATVSSVRGTRDETRSASGEFVGTYEPDASFEGIQMPAQQAGVGLMMRLEQRKQEWAQRAGGIRGAVADLEAMDAENGDAIDAVDTDLETTEI